MSVSLSIDNDTAKRLNSGHEILDDLLILRLEGGRDFYLTVKARYARSSFGMSVDELVLYPQPIRAVPLDPIEKAEKIDPKAPALCIPKELWRIVDALSERGYNQPGIFTEPGNPDEVDQIRECVDTGAPFGQFRVHSYAEALMEFLESLSSPIISHQLFPSGEIDSGNIQYFARRFLEEIPPIHYNVFVYVISFFREVLVHREKNKLSAAKVARICCSGMAPGNELDNSNSSEQKRTGMQLIMLHLLETSSI
jgi:inositol polyphosphate 5-phosphatase INPP5B/F